MFNYPKMLRCFSAAFMMLIVCALSIAAQTTAFTYQGRFTDTTVAQPTNGTYTMKFRLYDALADGTQSGSEQTVSVSVVNGIFTTSLDFGAVPFAAGQPRWLEIQIGALTLTPRQKIGSAPYAVRAISSAAADALSESCNSCVASSQIASLDGTKIIGAVADATNAVNATNAANAANATNAVNFSGNLTGDVTGTQNATVVNSVGGVTAANLAGSVTTVTAATDNNTPNSIVKRDASGNFTAGTITAYLNGNAATSTIASSIAATSGDSIVNALNNAATTGNINSSRLSSDVVLINPSTTQIPFGKTEGNTALLNLTGNYSACGNTYQSSFRLNVDGGLLSVGNFDSGCSGFVPTEGSGTRMFWYPGKGAFRAGSINGTQWDDANIGLYSTAFGENVRALGDDSIAIGKNTVAAGTGTIAFGEGNTATGANSIALGYGASTSTNAGSPRLGTFVFSDRSVPLCYSVGTNIDSSCQFHPTVTNSFNVRAINGSFFYTNTTLTTGFNFNSTTANLTLTNSKLAMLSDGSTTIYSNSSLSSGVTLPAGGGSWSSVSDRNMKENFVVVDPRDVLRKVLNLPISTWNYKSQNTTIRHIGPMAQDFYRLFGVGEDDKRIATIDPDGVTFAAIQGLNEELKDRDVKIEAQQKTIEAQQKQLNELSDQVKKQQVAIESLMKIFCSANPKAEVCKP